VKSARRGSNVARASLAPSPEVVAGLTKSFRARSLTSSRSQHVKSAACVSARFGAHGWALQRALSRQSMPLGLEARNGRAVHNYGNGPGTTRPALGLNRPSWRGVG